MHATESKVVKHAKMCGFQCHDTHALSLVLQTVWEQVNQDADNDPAVENDQTPANFDARLREFVRAHLTEEDRCDLVNGLRNCKKPRSIPAQAFWHKFKELNGCVEWLPGNEPALTEAQMKQAFHDAMPEKWRERFSDAGDTVTNQTMAEMVHHFRAMESAANRRMTENNE